MKVLILGDSHITWLDRFVRATRPGGTDGFVVDGHNCVVRCVGRPGATLPRLHTSAVRRRVEAEAAQIVILHVGGNVLDSLPSHNHRQSAWAFLCLPNNWSAGEFDMSSSRKSCVVPVGAIPRSRMAPVALMPSTNF